MIAAKLLIETTDKPAAILEWYKQIKPIATFLGQKNFLMGVNVALPDFLFFEMIEYAMKLTNNKIFTEYPNLQAYHERIKNLPGLKEYLESDRAFKSVYLPPSAKIQL